LLIMATRSQALLRKNPLFSVPARPAAHVARPLLGEIKAERLALRLHHRAARSVFDL